MFQHKVSQETAGQLSEVQMGNQYTMPSWAFSGTSDTQMETASAQNQLSSLNLVKFSVKMPSKENVSFLI